MVRYVTAAPDKPNYALEQPFCRQGAVIGVDEAGRGPWAGPVTAAAFWINPERKDKLPKTLTDSKKLSALKREQIRQELCAPDNGHLWAIRHTSVVEIDRAGILSATFLAMADAVYSLADLLAKRRNIQLSMVLIDGNLLPLHSLDPLEANLIAQELFLTYYHLSYSLKLYHLHTHP